MLRIGLALVALVLIGMVGLGVGTALGIVQISSDGIAFGRSKDEADPAAPAATIVSADDLLKQKGIVYTPPAPALAAPTAPPTTAPTQGAVAAVAPGPKAEPAKVPLPAVVVAAAVAAPAPQAPNPEKHLDAIRINAGGPRFTDRLGNTWEADNGFDNGGTVDRGPIAIANTTTPELYRTERFGMTRWHRDVPNGHYTVKLHFCETYDLAFKPGLRVFNFVVQQQPVRDFDVFNEAGTAQSAVIKTYHVTVTDKTLTIAFESTQRNVPEINAIEVIPE